MEIYEENFLSVRLSSKQQQIRSFHAVAKTKTAWKLTEYINDLTHPQFHAAKRND